ncbi:glycoside hydrolase family 71/99-like protein [Mucilaginibacter sp. PAMB04168]|uniref:glycoside hydrolase family 71/99-like protein n=1 Tax=Mucilaginibacter sp. PAMB04168 TaxID=3138567 RepID=UPI0031F71DA4
MRFKPWRYCLSIGLGLLAALPAFSQKKHNKNTLFPNYKGLIMAGYQGWFRAEGDGTQATRFSYGNEQRSGIDMWPDISEYKQTYPTPFKQADGKTARFFSSVDKSTADLHFQWMQQYGVDGVFMQRFFSTAREKGHRKDAVQVLKNAIDAASKYKRAMAIMYDLSGLKASGEDCSALIEDWKYLVDELKITNMPGTNTYLQQNGKPVVAIWGVGFPDRPYNVRNIGLDRFIDFLKNDPVYGGCAVLLGVPNSWRTLRGDCINDPYLHELIKQCDIVLPWSVQRYTPLLHNDMDRYRDDIIDDLQWCRANNIDYVPCVYPGFSWHNLSRYEFPDDVKPVGSIPRQGGRYYWQMLSTAIGAGAPMIYVAMFDEVNEGTAIFKVSNTPPVTSNPQGVAFADLDGKPSDHYLWLTGEAGKMLRKEKPLVFKMPDRQVVK